MLIAGIVVVCGASAVIFSTVPIKSLVEKMFYFFKIVSLIWIVFVPIQDYMYWTTKEKLNRRLSALFYVFLFLMVTVILIASTSMFNPWVYNNIIMGNGIFLFCMGIIPLACLAWADYEIGKFIKSEFKKYKTLLKMMKNYLANPPNTLTQDEIAVINFEVKQYCKFVLKAPSEIKFFESS